MISSNSLGLSEMAGRNGPNPMGGYFPPATKSDYPGQAADPMRIYQQYNTVEAPKYRPGPEYTGGRAAYASNAPPAAFRGGYRGAYMAPRMPYNTTTATRYDQYLPRTAEELAPPPPNSNVLIEDSWTTRPPPPPLAPPTVVQTQQAKAAQRRDLYSRGPGPELTAFTGGEVINNPSQQNPSVWTMPLHEAKSARLDFASPAEVKMASQVAAEFAYHYFHLMQTQPQMLHCFYCADSQVAHGSSILPVTRWNRAVGEREIEVFFRDLLKFEGSSTSVIQRSHVKTLEAQPTKDGGIVMQATGVVETRDLGARPFAHTIVMHRAPEAGSYVVLHDIFVFLDDLSVEHNGALGVTFPVVRESPRSVPATTQTTQKQDVATSPLLQPQASQSLESAAANTKSVSGAEPATQPSTQEHFEPVQQQTSVEQQQQQQSAEDETYSEEHLPSAEGGEEEEEDEEEEEEEDEEEVAVDAVEGGDDVLGAAEDEAEVEDDEQLVDEQQQPPAATESIAAEEAGSSSHHQNESQLLLQQQSEEEEAQLDHEDENIIDDKADVDDDVVPPPPAAAVVDSSSTSTLTATNKKEEHHHHTYHQIKPEIIERQSEVGETDEAPATEEEDIEISLPPPQETKKLQPVTIDNNWDLPPPKTDATSQWTSSIKAEVPPPPPPPAPRTNHDIDLQTPPPQQEEATTAPKVVKTSAWKTIAPQQPARPIIVTEEPISPSAAVRITPPAAPTISPSKYGTNTYAARLLSGVTEGPKQRGTVLKRSSESASTSPSTQEQQATETHAGKAIWVSQLENVSDAQIEKAVEQRLKGCPVEGRVVRIERMKNGPAGVIELDSEDCVPMLLERGLCLGGREVRIDLYKQSSSREPSPNQAARRVVPLQTREPVAAVAPSTATDTRPGGGRGWRPQQRGPYRGVRPQPMNTEDNSQIVQGDWEVAGGRGSRRGGLRAPATQRV